MNNDELELAHRRLSKYLRKKEQLTRDNLWALEKRGSFIGLFTSFIPPFRITALLRNYGNHCGILYKIFHLRENYKAGERVLFPDLRAFYGARIKDVLTKRKNRESVEIRQRNMGYALHLLRHIDAALYGGPENQPKISFSQAVFDQISIKVMRKEQDSFYKLLKKIYKSTDEFAQALSEEKLIIKSRYLDYLSANYVDDDFVRGKLYSIEQYDNAEQTSPQKIWETLKNAAKTPLPAVSSILRPIGNFQTELEIDFIEVRSLVRMGDRWMHMNLAIENYEDYCIKGVDKDTNRLIGKDDEMLEDRWYQFVILQDPHNKQPVIRYYPCGDKRDKIPFAMQNPQHLQEGVQEPREHALKYEKYIAHSELSGGVPVIAAGAFMIKDGQLKVIEDSSGHYALPSNAEDQHKPLKLSREIFAYFGADTNATILEHWKPYKGLDKICKKTAGMFAQSIQSSTLKKHGISPQLAELRATQPEKMSPIRLLVSIS